MNKKNWIYQIRGLAIIAVVIWHQQGILHNTEVLQGFTLYSVTTLVFLMGVTKALSMKKNYASDSQCDKIFVYSLNTFILPIDQYPTPQMQTYNMIPNNALYFFCIPLYIKYFIIQEKRVHMNSIQIYLYLLELDYF